MAHRVAVGGGTGFVGRALVAALRQRGDEALVISRRAGRGTVTWDDIAAGTGLDGCTAVVNLAGANILNFFRRWNDAYKREVHGSRIDTCTTLRKAIAAMDSPPQVFVTASGIGIYPPHISREYSEDSQLIGQGSYLAELARDWEASAQLPPGTAARNVYCRLGVVLGKDGGAFQQARLPFWLGLGGRLGSGQQPMPWIHIDDAVGIILHAIDNAAVEGPINTVAPQQITNAQYTAAFARALSRPAIFPVPAFVLNTLLGAERASVLLEGQYASPRKILATDYSFRFPTIDAAMENLCQ